MDTSPTLSHHELKARSHANLDTALESFAKFADDVDAIKALGQWRSDGNGYTRFDAWFKDEYHAKFGAMYSRFQQMQRALPTQQRVKDELGIEISERTVRPLLSTYESDEQIDIIRQAKRVSEFIGDNGNVAPRHITAVINTRNAITTTGSIPFGGMNITPENVLDYETFAEAHEVAEATQRMNEHKQRRWRKVGAKLTRQQGRMVYLLLDEDVELPEVLTLSIEDLTMGIAS